MDQPDFDWSGYVPNYRAALHSIARHNVISFLVWLAITGGAVVSTFYHEPTYTFWRIGDDPQLAKAVVTACTQGHLHIAYEAEGKAYQKVEQIRGCEQWGKIVDIQYARDNPDLVTLSRHDLRKEALTTLKGTAALAAPVAFILLVIGADLLRQKVPKAIFDEILHLGKSLIE